MTNKVTEQPNALIIGDGNEMKLVRTLLEMKGFRCTTATNYGQATELLGLIPAYHSFPGKPYFISRTPSETDFELIVAQENPSPQAQADGEKDFCKIPSDQRPTIDAIKQLSSATTFFGIVNGEKGIGKREFLSFPPVIIVNGHRSPIGVVKSYNQIGSLGEGLEGVEKAIDQIMGWKVVHLENWREKIARREELLSGVGSP